MLSKIEAADRPDSCANTSVCSERSPFIADAASVTQGSKRPSDTVANPPHTFSRSTLGTLNSTVSCAVSTCSTVTS